MGKSILVVGGAGYIGSHMVQMLSENGFNVTVFDNLSSGHADAVITAPLIKGDLGLSSDLESLFSSYHFDAVMHFASSIQVGESMRRPDLYYHNNVVNTLNLLNVMRAHGVEAFIFSSTAATFGNPIYLPLDENHPQAPINPYGRTKHMVEQILSDYNAAYGLRSIVLRYFNAAGAHPNGLLGERHDPETHLIPLVLQVASGKRDAIQIFGQDYPTPDGTCIRDYIHVSDLCYAHLLSLMHLLNGGGSRSYNLGNGEGFSVKDVIRTAEEVTGRIIPAIASPARLGDPPRLIANSALIQSELNWQPKYGDLSTIIEHAWRWELRAR